MEESRKYTFSDLVEIVGEIRRKCPWDSVQTHQSLEKYLREETEEVIEAIEELLADGNGNHLCEELGDILFHVLLHCAIAKEEGIFSIDDVISRISQKMQFRHPRIFSPDDEEATALSWDELKEREHSLFSGRQL